MSIMETISSILNDYTSGDHYEELKSAKQAFISKTGQIDEEAEEYESRMNSFNDWYLFNYKKNNDIKIIDDYIQNNSVDDEVINSLKSINYSLFLFSKINFRKQVVIKDVLHNVKFTLSGNHGDLALVEDDLFIGRCLDYKNEKYFLSGICTLPREILSVLKKESKKIKKLNNSDEEEAFLLNLERLKIKSLQYGHIESSKIFIF